MYRILLALALVGIVSSSAKADTDEIGFNISITTVTTMNAAAGLTCADTTYAFAGAQKEDGCFLGPANGIATTTGYSFTCHVSNTDAVIIRACCQNGTGVAGVAVACSALPANARIRIYLRRY